MMPTRLCDDRHALNGLKRREAQFGGFSPRNHKLLLVLKAGRREIGLQIALGEPEHRIDVFKLNAFGPDRDQGAPLPLMGGSVVGIFFDGLYPPLALVMQRKRAAAKWFLGRHEYYYGILPQQLSQFKIFLVSGASVDLLFSNAMP
jgi:hypothetical protein